MHCQEWTIQDLWSLEKIGFVDETPGGFLDAWDGDSPVVLGGDNVFLFGEVGNRRFGLRRIDINPFRGLHHKVIGAGY